jgi:hypothetical protein
MSDTPNCGIPYVSEGVLDVAASSNAALNVIDALLQTRVISMFVNDPPVTNADGDMYIVGVGTGDWAGKDDYLARWVSEGEFWQFFTPGVQISLLVDQDTGSIQFYDSINISPPGWIVIGTISDAPSDGSQYARKDGAWVVVTPPRPTTATAVTNSAGTVTLDYAAGDYFTHTMTANITTLAFSNLPGSGKSATLMLKIVQDSTPRTLAWPASFKWAGGAAPSISTASGAVDVLAMTTFDNGTTWAVTLAKAFA